MIGKKVADLERHDVFRYRGRLYPFDQWTGFQWPDHGDHEGDVATFHVEAWPMETPLRAAGGGMRRLKVRGDALLPVLE